MTAASKKDAEALAAEPPRIENVESQDTGDKAVLPLILKADVTGSIEAIKHELRKVTHERAAVKIVGEGLGAVTEGDVKQALAGGAIIIAFTVGTDSVARDLADRMNVSIESFSIIYDLEKRVAELLAARAPQITVEEAKGEAKILRMFSVTGNKRVLGANLLSGEIAVGDSVKLSRRGVELGYGKVGNLQQARADVKELRTEGEFGAMIETKEDIAQGDTITPFKLVTK